MTGFFLEHTNLLPLIFPLYFVVLWVLVGSLISRIGGWRALAQRYRTEKQFPDHRRRFQSGKMRAGIGYNNVLTLASDPEGLYLGVMILFRMGHPNLFVTWSEIEFEEPKQWLFYKVQTLRLGPDRTPLRLRVSLVDFLLVGKGPSGAEI